MRWIVTRKNGRWFMRFCFFSFINKERTTIIQCTFSIVIFILKKRWNTFTRTNRFSIGTFFCICFCINSNWLIHCNIKNIFVVIVPFFGLFKSVIILFHLISDSLSFVLLFYLLLHYFFKNMCFLFYDNNIYCLVNYFFVVFYNVPITYFVHLII